MKQHINKWIILVILFFFMMPFGNRTTEANGTADLLTLASVLEGERITIDEWSIHAREKLSKQDNAEEYARELKKQFPKWEWTFSKKQQKWEVTGIAPQTSKTASQNHAPLEEKIRIISTPTNKDPHAYIIYEVKGYAWDQDMEEFLIEDLPSTISYIFRDNPTFFSCMKADISDKMKSTLSSKATGLLAAFQADEIESLSEESFISVTATSPLFAESLKKNNQENINLQLGLRTQGMGAKTTLVVGTPIITIEY